MPEEEKKPSFPWVQLIATIGTILAALIGITPYILKLNAPSSTPQTPTIVVVTLPQAVVTPAPVTTSAPLAGPAITMAVNTSSVSSGDYILASGSTDPLVPRVIITLTNSTTFQSAAVPIPLTKGAYQFQLDTSVYAPGDYTITAAVPDTQAGASASFIILSASTPEPTPVMTTTSTTAAETTPVTTSATTAPTTVAETTTAAPTTAATEEPTTTTTTIPVTTTPTTTTSP